MFMYKEFFINLSKTFTFLRFRLDNDYSKLFLECFHGALKEEINQDNFYKHCMNSLEKYDEVIKFLKKNFVENSSKIKLEKELYDLINYILDESILALKEKNLKKAYDFIDTFHFFPETAIHQKLDGKSFWESYIIPLRKKWELNKLIHFEKFFYSLQIK